MCRYLTSDYGSEAAVLQQAEQESGAWAWPGPARATKYIVACVPSFVDGGSSESVAAGKGTACVGSVGTLGHIDADEVGSGAH
jgi:hypothetical protein